MAPRALFEKLTRSKRHRHDHLNRVCPTEGESSVAVAASVDPDDQLAARRPLHFESQAQQGRRDAGTDLRP